MYFFPAKNAAPTANTTLEEKDLEKLLEELLPAQTRAKELGLKLKLPPYVVESTHKTYKEPQDHLYHILLEFLRQAEPRPTWRVIIDALRSPVVNLSRLAERMEAAHLLHPTAIRNTVPGMLLFTMHKILS